MNRIDRKIIFVLVLLSAVVFAQQAIVDALCNLQRTAETMMAMLIVLSILFALPIIAAGIIFCVKKKPRKKLGIVLMIIGVILPIIFMLIYLLIPMIVYALMGGGTEIECY